MYNKYMDGSGLQKGLLSKFLFLISFLFLTIAFACISPNSAYADSFNAGKIIDDAVFTDKGTMNTSQIQAFLNAKVPSCDTNGTQPSEFGGGTRAQWGASHNHPAPFTCLKDYSEGGRSAAQIIYDTAQQYQINPQILIVLLQKEQGLVTDTWPIDTQYKTATGYGCPDTAPCDTQYYGLSNQLGWSGKMFRAILNNSPTWYTPYILGNNFIRYSPVASCGGGTVNIQNRSTQALYNYTPYQPNAAALAASMGSIVDCGAYGNINFFRYFTSWFGSTTGPANAWNLNSTQLYYDASLTQPVASRGGAYQLAPNQKVYAKISVTNTGRTTWPKSATRFGTFAPYDHPSVFADGSWISNARTAGYKESGDIAPQDNATFVFSITAPTVASAYGDTFSVVIDGIAWITNTSSPIRVDVVNAPLPVEAYANTTLTSGTSLFPGQTLFSNEGNSTLQFKKSGNLELWVNFRKVWETATAGATTLSNQSDGNLVLYRNSTPLWSSGTSSASPSTLSLQSDGNLVLRNSTTATWASGTSTYNQTNLVNSILLPGDIVHAGQIVYTPNRYYKLGVQNDGNIVLYASNRPIWLSNSFGHVMDFISFQNDGNLVAYDKDGRAFWASNTFGSTPNLFALQQDGNMVLYSISGPRWSSGTLGIR